MFRLHPYEYLYLSEWVGGFQRSQGRFPGDYWAASASEGLQWLHQERLTDPDRVYRIHIAGFTAIEAVSYLPLNAKWTYRLEDSDYHVGTGPLFPLPSGARLIHQIQREGLPLLWIYQLK
jgi:hypothetical protein